MKNLKTLVLFASIAFLGACGSSTKILGSWTSPKSPSEPYKSIFVTAISENLIGRQSIENDIEDFLQKADVVAKSSFEIMPPGFKASLENKDATIASIIDTGSDAILTVALLDQTSETRYVPGTTMYSPTGHGGNYGRFYGYYSYYNPIMYDPGYYTKEKTYYLEINLYDATTEELVWSAQSETTNPSSIDTFSRNFSQLVVKQLIKDGLISK